MNSIKYFLSLRRQTFTNNIIYKLKTISHRLNKNKCLQIVEFLITIYFWKIRCIKNFARGLSIKGKKLSDD